MWLLTIVPQTAWLVLSHDPGMASRQVAPTHWFLSMPYSTSSSFSLNPNGSGPPLIPDQSAYYVLKCLQPTNSSLQLTNKSRKKSHSQPPSACHLITLQHLASPFQPNLPTRPTVCLPFFISSLLKTKTTSKFSCFIQYTADFSFESEETAGFKRLFIFYYLHQTGAPYFQRFRL